MVSQNTIPSTSTNKHKYNKLFIPLRRQTTQQTYDSRRLACFLLLLSLVPSRPRHQFVASSRPECSKIRCCPMIRRSCPFRLRRKPETEEMNIQTRQIPRNLHILHEHTHSHRLPILTDILPVHQQSSLKMNRLVSERRTPNQFQINSKIQITHLPVPCKLTCRPFP